MAFRAYEVARAGYKEVENYFVPKLGDVDESERVRSREALLDIVDEIDPRC